METVAAPTPCRVIAGWRISVGLTLNGHSVFTLRPLGGINLPVYHSGFKRQSITGPQLNTSQLTDNGYRVGKNNQYIKYKLLQAIYMLGEIK